MRLSRPRERGYDPRIVSMHGLFVAAGPRLLQGVIVPRFENVHVYDFQAKDRSSGHAAVELAVS